jgi:hypothetical protein
MLNAANVIVLELSEQISDQNSADEATAPTVTAFAPTPMTELGVFDLKQQNAELQKRLAISREDLTDMAADACRMLRKIAELQAQLAVMTLDRDAWRTQAERLSIPLSLRAWRQRRARRDGDRGRPSPP